MVVETFVEIHGRDLVDKYVGWTAQKVHKTVEKAIGGVLFIDEAYSLVADKRGGFEDDAIANIIKGNGRPQKRNMYYTCRLY